ncbi:NB-ARC domain containing protein [Trema orientale]|uniref:NB-ARC domain containing protein n=1 Tax=Trema orientale TaxID=63057 RepID=A0A2P5D5H5_TREOI|nr:NB-ARC domain containing protein [Trema orientale]
MFELGFWATLSLVQQKVELVKQIWGYVLLFPEWLNYLNEFDEKVKTLRRKQEVLSSIEDDINETLKGAEFETGKKRKREVEIWLENVKRRKENVQSIEQEITEKKYFLRPWLGSCIDRNLQEVQELCEQGQFPEGLFLDVIPTSREPLVTQSLVGQDSNLETIWEWLNDSNVSRIGVYGRKGVGKTAILIRIQNRLLDVSTSTFEHVYWVSVPEKPSVHKLQDVIAKQVGLSLSDEEDKIIRAAKLHRALTLRNRCVIILDGVWKPFIDEVGIPSQRSGCKLILSTQTLRDCRRMDCQRTLEIKPLSHEEAMDLFKEKLSSSAPLGRDFEDIMDQIVKECQGLPLWIVTEAEELRGVEDINEWRNALAEAREYRN